MSKIREFFDRLRGLVEDIDLYEQTRAWDGSASNYASTEAYCAACLIDLNSAAGRDEKAQSYCKLPVKAAGSGSYDFEGIQAAAGAIAGARGGMTKPSGVSEDDWQSAVKAAANTIISQYNANDAQAPDAVYEAAGKTPPERERAIALQRLYDQLWASLETREAWAWPLDLYWDGGDLYALVAEEGKLYRVGLEVEGEAMRLGDWVQVTESHPPVGRMVIRQQGDGAWRWFSIAATAVLNRVGEIDSTVLFDNFVARFKGAESEGRPRRDFFHLGDAGVFGDVDFLERDGWCLLASGVFHETPLGQAMRRAIQAEPERWGDSISYLPLAEAELVEVAEGVRVPVYSDGELRYISSLYESRAASPFTTARVQEVKRMRAEVMEALQGLKQHGLPDEEIEEIVAAVDGTNRQIDDENLVRRDAEDAGTDDGSAPEGGEPEAAQEPEPEEEPEDAEPEADRELVLDDEALGAIVARVLADGQLLDLQELIEVHADQIEMLRAELDEAHARSIQHGERTDKRIQALERDEEEKRREWQADLPARATQRTVVSYRPRDAKADGDGDGEPDLASVAEQTLSQWH